MIRLSSAVDLGSSLSVNTTLLYLDLSCNSLGKDGGEAIGEAVLNNRTLRTLILSSNGIESRACFTICMGIIEVFSSSLLYVIHFITCMYWHTRNSLE